MYHSHLSLCVVIIISDQSYNFRIVVTNLVFSPNLKRLRLRKPTKMCDALTIQFKIGIKDKVTISRYYTTLYNDKINTTCLKSQKYYTKLSISQTLAICCIF